MKHLFFLLFATSLLPLTAWSQTIPAGRAIEIRIQGVPQEETVRVNNAYPVSESGFIRMPFIGNIRAAGLTPVTLAQNIENAYKAAKIYTHPTIQVFASSDQSIDELKVTVGGQVRNPGPVPYHRGLTLYDAVQAARGATEFGSIKRVKVLRAGRLMQFDLRETRSKMFQLQPDDSIEIPDKGIFGG